ncbi:MAG TPA: glycine betaine ABC transporter substrate-binding protein, partial [Rubrivivax sp.]|nr:glycine betaine ABC transporter substrate-binding protein [Rubrivivax sp.]
MTPFPRFTLATLAAALVLAACSKTEEPPAPAGTAAAAECGKVTVANMNWQSAEVLAQIDAFILGKGYGCDVELVPGDTMPTLTAMMERGQPDVAPEAWINAVRDPLDAAVKQGRLHYAVKALPDGSVEGWWIPKYVADANPGIRTIDDALAHPELFPAPEAQGKGAVHNCPSGWTCQITTANAFKAWGAAAKGFVLVDTGSAAGLDGSLAKA